MTAAAGSPGTAGGPSAAGTDVRLAAGAAGAWLVLVVCTGRAVVTVLVVAAAAVVTGLVATRLARSDGRFAVPALVGYCIALVLLPYAGRLHHARASVLAQLAREHAAVSVELTVRDDPRALAARGIQGSLRVLVPAAASAVVAAGTRHGSDGDLIVLAPAGQWSQLLPGQRLRADGLLQPPLDAADTVVVLSARSPPELLGTPPWWQRAAGVVRTDLRRACAGLPAGVRGLLPGLVDGDISDLDAVLQQRFRVAGLTHLVAVSGTNCSILVGAALLLLRRLRAGPRMSAAVGLVVVAAFVVVARPSPSVLRAALMGSIALAGLATGRPGRAVPALAAAVLGLLLWDPALALDAGFTMSVLATAAILLIAPAWAVALRRRRVPGGLAELFAVAAAAHLVSAPVIAAISGRVSLVAIPANVLAEPVVAAATVLGFLAAVVAPLWFGLGASIAWLAGWPVRWLVWDGEHFGALAGATVPWPGGLSGAVLLLAVTAALLLLCRRPMPRRTIAATAAVALVVQLPVRSMASNWPPAGWLLVACDIGQGDALLLRAGPHSAVEIDAGPDPVAVDRCLRDVGVTDVPLLVLTHFHLDHVGGLPGALHDRHVGRVLTGPLDEPEAGAAVVRTALAARGLPLGTVRPGMRLEAGPVQVSVLGPEQAYHGTRSDPNNSSVVLRATVQGVRVLLPGDAEMEAQDALLDSGADLHADVLKVPHHGSAYSAERFLAAVGAQVAVISVGAHNDYGHPSPRLLQMLARLGVPARRTDRDGDVAVCGTAAQLRVLVHGTAASAA